MSTFVLIHGAWHGGWAWQRLVPELRAAGHEVHTPTLTGLSGRAHTLTPQVGLSTHVQDVVGLLEGYDVRDAVLVGHSYAGQVVTGVADRVPERLSLRVHLDAFVGDHGEAAVDLLPAGVAEHWREAAAGPGFGWLVPPRSLTKLGVTDQADLDWLIPRLTPHPWLTYTEPLQLTGRSDQVAAAFIECVDWMRVFQGQAERATNRDWPIHRIATGHEAMVTAPNELAALLLDVANRI
ncbi:MULTISPECIES: alpha/beta fold hydrolase [Prauserella salsuginis group]|uniref:Alpha/beta fold hydrolase n=1 Tax=Prauserella salsuginis TaxID=387889 RepID=A0ABW6G0T1_9PSEU|nr:MULTISPECIES: alpha/beta fold hydrolase [Prauserella salsuginis group]MCR3721967.1 Pimeloyl-ACP methyl ester carboxylesterase [Prauserella flava]MCR3735973.1 Pimeloyl-ACP methyl ester carboxylesterase [Prauserella salsuginis]